MTETRQIMFVTPRHDGIYVEGLLFHITGNYNYIVRRHGDRFWWWAELTEEQCRCLHNSGVRLYDVSKNEHQVHRDLDEQLQAERSGGLRA
jgi:hypothetical protein